LGYFEKKGIEKCQAQTALGENPGYIEPYNMTGVWVHMDWGPSRMTKKEIQDINNCK